MVRAKGKAPAESVTNGVLPAIHALVAPVPPAVLVGGALGAVGVNLLGRMAGRLLVRGLPLLILLALYRQVADQPSSATQSSTHPKPGRAPEEVG
jgi:hypothetical protein